MYFRPSVCLVALHSGVRFLCPRSRFDDLFSATHQYTDSIITIVCGGGISLLFKLL